MGEVEQGKATRVYMDGTTGRVVFQLFFVVCPVVILFIALPRVIAGGGMWVPMSSRSGTSLVWVPASILVPAFLIVGLLVVSLGIQALRATFDGKIVIDDEGVGQTDIFGKVNFRARWNEITGTSQDGQGNTLVHAGPATLKIAPDHRCLLAILDDITEHTGRGRSKPADGSG